MIPDDDNELPEPAILLTSLLWLMTGFARVRCPRQAVLIERQLDYLQTYPDALMPPKLKSAARRLSAQWRELLQELPCAEPSGAAAGGRPRLH